jgi:2-oxoglutarate dehydrogenase E1 component
MADKFTYLANAHSNVVDEMFSAYKADPDSVDYGWQKFFEGFEFGAKDYNGSEMDSEHFLREIAVMNLIEGYRSRGHLFTETNPVRKRRTYIPDLSLQSFGLTEADLDTVFQAGHEAGLGATPLRDIISFLEDTYCRSIGAEYRYIRKPEEVNWLRERIEKDRNTPRFEKKDKHQIFDLLNEAVSFERFLHTKYVGQKRFSLEGMESFIPALDTVIEYGADLGIEEFIIGMAHRGRLNVLANVMHKKLEDIFREFEGEIGWDSVLEDDVKYHLGFSSNKQTRNGKNIHLRLAANPSHLESVNPVVEGMTRAKLEKKYQYNEKKIAPVLIHGDASLAAQGIVYELIQMSKLRGYQTGGTIHIALNNQVGFTTNYLDGRSSTYCTDVAKVTLSPVFHVNADDVEAVVHTLKLAMEYRQAFHKDVFIDLLGYRKYGHNEGDEPRYTQPKLYEAIAKHLNPKEIYASKLLAEGSISQKEIDTIERRYKEYLDDRHDASKSLHKHPPAPFAHGNWIGFRQPRKGDFRHPPETGVAGQLLVDIGLKVVHVPEDIPVFKKIRKLFEDRRQMLTESKMLDWAMGELLAYGTLLVEGATVRIAGQDVERGTFAHRHAVLTQVDSEERYIPLKHLSPTQAKFHIYNSLLSEYAALGFEFGYSMSTPLGLTVWEAQFGDFANGAQIIFDQYISASAVKWQRMSGLTVFLPHGFEGQGPEHSSARIERMLELCADNNMQVTMPTTPANLFHLLRRQVNWPFRLPLIVLTPKSLLRHPKVKSPFDDFTHGHFLELIEDPVVTEEKARRVVFCSGKIYYDLLEKQEKDNIGDVAIIRVEQLYPLPIHQLLDITKRYANVKEWVWAQEEPENMGAWAFILRHLRDFNIQYVGRVARSSPATGSAKIHAREQAEIVEKAFAEVL